MQQSNKEKLETMGYTVEYGAYAGYSVVGRCKYIVTGNHFIEQDAVDKALKLIEVAKTLETKPVWLK